MTARYAALRAAAEAAPAGEWHQSEHEPRSVCADVGSVSIWVSNFPTSDAHRVGAYVAAAQPAAILALLADIDAAREALRGALSAFKTTQRLADYPPDHWAARADAALARLDGESAP